MLSRVRDVGKLFELDSRSLALYRVLLGCVLLYDTAARLFEARAFYTDLGVLPRAPYVEQFQGRWSWSLHLLSGEASVQYVLFALAALCAAAFVAGYRTRLAALGSLLLLISLHNRNPFVISASDQLMRVLMFWTLFLPAGAAYSLDRALARDDAGPPRARVANVSAGTAAFILQVCLVYWFTAALKSDTAWWREGSALYYALSIDYLTTDFGRLLLGFPALLTALSYFTVAFEAAGPALLFLPRRNGPVRTAVVFAFVLFHLGMTPFLTLGTFPFVCAAMWSALLPAWFWERAAGRPARAAGPAAPTPPTTTLTVAAAATPMTTPEARRAPAWANALAAAFFAYTLLWNFATATAGRVVVPEQVAWVGHATGLAQVWNMFAPIPKKEDGWYVIPARLAGGGEVDLFRGGAPVNWAKPPDASALYPDSYWQKYLEYVWLADFAPLRLHYARYLCRQWNGAHDGADRLKTFDVVYMREDTPPPGRPLRPAEPLVVWRHDCQQ
ncbi:MAG TPA: HTTM domain-containing protein [Pyrinomonadaceae bacterium]|jgi:hypothetical protein